MQLMTFINNKRKSRLLKDSLAVAATALVASPSQAAEPGDGEWEFAASVLGYTESDRVSAFEFIGTAEKVFHQTGKLSYKAVLDTLTGASANGAIPQRSAQTFTRPSGEGQYIVGANDVPLDDTFKDTRGQGSISWSDVIDETSRYTVGAYLSREFDYTSVSVNGEYAMDLNQRNTTLSIASSIGVDQIKPKGGLPLPFASMVIDRGQFPSQADFDAAYRATRGKDSETINNAELLLGLTQVINRRWLTQVNVGYANASGYLTDPFKILSLVDNNGITQDYLYENRPDSRTKTTFFALSKYHLDNSILDFSYRYMSDDWDIKSHTLDFRWHLFADKDTFWEPHVRYYQQDAANFYTPYLVQGEPLPEFASADYRVGKMNAWTIGLKYGFKLNGHRAEIRGEYYRQTPEAIGPERVNGLDGLDLYSQVDAFIVQFSYYF